jgi:transcriptional regulator with XRE-family HTH domain
MTESENIVGRNLRRLRRGRRLTQIQLAEAAGMSPDTIVKTEGGHQLPRLSSLVGLANALGVEVVDFYRPEDAWLDHQTPVEELSDGDLEDIRRLLEGGSPVARFLEDDPAWLRKLSQTLLEETMRLRQEKKRRDLSPQEPAPY